MKTCMECKHKGWGGRVPGRKEGLMMSGKAGWRERGEGIRG